VSVRGWPILAAVGAFFIAPTGASANGVFFSEYVEGTGSNKALEVFNASGANVDLSAYSVLIYQNGAVIPAGTIALTGTLAGGDTYVLANSSADPAINADQLSSELTFTGDDAVELRQGVTTVDVIGQIGVDPGSAWGSGSAVTQDATLRRKPQITSGDTVGSDSFDPADQWLGFALDTFGGLGAHSLAVDPPAISGTDPGSPANDNDPLVHGTVGAGSPTIVQLYTNATCSGAPAATAPVGDFTATGIPVHVADDSGTDLSALASDGTTDSLCSNSVRYIEDSTAPETTITSAPPSVTDDSTPTFAFSSVEQASFECRVDGAPFGSCSGPGEQHTTAPLADGSHTFEVKAVDLAGNMEPVPAKASFTVNTTPVQTDPPPEPPQTNPRDTIAPETMITKGPAKKTTKRKVTFAFASSETPVAFECKLDKADFAACVSGVRLKVKPGRHTFAVRATDAAGNVDQTPALRRFKVKRR
jgi:hypothetical protein